MMLPFTDGLVRVGKGDYETALLSDRHYSRQKIGSPQFMPPGRTMVLRNSEGTVVFGWLWQDGRDDRQRGINCSIFRNESEKLSSHVILEAERAVVDEWGGQRLFTYIDPAKLHTVKRRGREMCPWPPGRCFQSAGWKRLTHKDGRPYRSTRGLWLFVKVRNFGFAELADA
jgi:hypothetical protein